MGKPQLPSDEVMREMSKMAIEQATEYFAKMAVTLAGEMRAAGHGAMITGPDALEAFAGASARIMKNITDAPIKARCHDRPHPHQAHAADGLGRPMTAARARLPNRRDNHVETLVVGGLEFTATVGFDPATDQPRELFLDGGKGGSGFAALLADVATTISVAIQYGVPIEALAKSMGRAPNVGTAPGSFEQLAAGPEPASPIGAALDLLCRLETPEPRVACKGAGECDH